MEWFFRVCVLWRLLYLRIFGMARDFTQLDAAYQNYKDKATVADDDKADLAAKSKARAETADAMAMGITLVIHVVLGWLQQDDEGIP